MSHNEKIWFWEEGYHGEEITSLEFFESKLSYIHMNPVSAGIVEKEEEYLNLVLALFTESVVVFWS